MNNDIFVLIEHLQSQVSEISYVMLASAKDLAAEKNEQFVIVKTLNAIAKMPDILNAIEDEGFAAVDVKLTKQSLETVFISLTGKELRGD